MFVFAAFVYLSRELDSNRVFIVGRDFSTFKLPLKSVFFVSLTQNCPSLLIFLGLSSKNKLGLCNTGFVADKKGLNLGF
jgi:hypothetical protein